MSIIKTHDITLYGSSSEYDIILRPLCDGHLPLLYKWNADPEVVYWSDTGNADVFTEEDVRGIYGSTSQTAFCFLVEVNGEPIGDFWLQKMNIPEILTKFPGRDVRRIEASIGEKDFWGKGIGTVVLGMMIDFAFNGEYADLLYCFAADYNLRSQKTLLKQGFVSCGEEDAGEESLRAKKEYHFRLTRQEYIDRRRAEVQANKIFGLPLTEIQPSQLYISEGKLRLARDWFDSADKSKLDPIPAKLYDGKYLMTDGHTRAALAALAGWDTVPVVWDDDPLDMLAYALDVRWCHEAGITSAANLANRIVPHKDYEQLWRKRCQEMVIPPSYAALVARFGGLDGRSRAIILTDNAMLETARLIQTESAPFVRKIDIINLDTAEEYSEIYALGPDDLLILHIGIENWMGRHRKHARAFDKPENVVAKYICFRPTVKAQALLEGLNTPLETTESIVRQYGNLPDDSPLRVTTASGTDITLTPYESWTIPYTTHTPGANAYLPPAEVSYSVRQGSASGVIAVDVTVGELRVYADLIDAFGLIDEPVKLFVENGEIVDITGGVMAKKLKTELWKLPENCRRIVELGIGLSRMTPSGIIGIDESIAGTCHFGFGSGSGNDAPIHLDVVVSEFLVVNDNINH